MTRIVFHIDVNNAFLSWEAIDLLKSGYEKDIRTIPSVIGGDPKKRSGIVLAKSPVAKKYGVVTAEPLYQAKRKCPNLLVYPPHYKIYQKYSNDLFKFIGKYTNEIERFSVDECFLEYTNIQKRYGDPVSFAYKLKDEIEKTFGFTVNIGVANCKLCAKMASDFEKPNKVHTLFANEIKEKMWPLPVQDLFMVGKQGAQKLNQLNIFTIKDLALADESYLKKHFKSRAKIMIENANGIDDSLVEEPKENKCIGNEITLEKDYDNIKDLLNILRRLSIKISKRLRDENIYCYNINLVLKNNLFKSYSHQTKLKNPTNNSNEIYAISEKLLREIWKVNEQIRLIGIRTSNFVNKSYNQLSLFDSDDSKVKDEKVERLMDEINNKYKKQVLNYTDIYK